MDIYFIITHTLCLCNTHLEHLFDCVRVFCSIPTEEHVRWWLIVGPFAVNGELRGAASVLQSHCVRDIEAPTDIKSHNQASEKVLSFTRQRTRMVFLAGRPSVLSTIKPDIKSSLYICITARR